MQVLERDHTQAQAERSRLDDENKKLRDELDEARHKCEMLKQELQQSEDDKRKLQRQYDTLW